MPQVPFTLRIPAAEREALENISKIEGRPINQLLNEAIQQYLHQPGRKERDLESRLRALREYRQKDASYQQAIDAFVEAEVSRKDPLEGEVPGSDKRRSGRVGSLQKKIRGVIGA